MKSGKVLTGMTQSLTNDEKATARGNIGAIDRAFDSGVDTTAEIVTALSKGLIPFTQHTIGTTTVLQLLSQLIYNTSGGSTTLTEAHFGLEGGRVDQNMLTGDILPRLTYNIIDSNGFAQSCAFGRPYPIGLFSTKNINIRDYGYNYSASDTTSRYMLWRRLNVERTIKMSGMLTEGITVNVSQMGGIYKLSPIDQPELFKSSSTWTPDSSGSSNGVYDVGGDGDTAYTKSRVLREKSDGNYKLINFNETITLEKGSYLIPAFSTFKPRVGGTGYGPMVNIYYRVTPVLTYCDLWLNDYENLGTAPDSSKKILDAMPTVLIYKNANNNNFFEVI